MRRTLRLLVPAMALLMLASFALPAGAQSGQQNMRLLANFPSDATNSDLAFWGTRAYAGNYNGFRIFDIRDPRRPRLLSDFECFGPQNDVTVWENRLLFTSIDRTLTGPRCGAGPTAEHDDPTGWEGIRIFDVSDPRNPRQIGAVYQDCGSHTHTLVPDLERNRLLLYNSSYPLRPGPTCGPVRGPEAGRDPLHGVIQVVAVPLDDPRRAREIAEPRINYPGDPDNQFDPAEHGLGEFGDERTFFPLRACHDIAVFMELRLVAAACAEQAQMWRMRANGLPDTTNPLWVFDDPSDRNGPTGDPKDPEVAVDFWHSATFSWDGRVVNFIDESFGAGCPPITENFFPRGERGGRRPADTGRAYFLDTQTGEKFSHFQIPRRERAEDAYCSAHLGNFVADEDNYYLANAWYTGGVDIVDATDLRNPREVAFFDAPPEGFAGSANWTHYWYEGPKASGERFFTYGQDGFGGAGMGFQSFLVDIGDGADARLPFLNPQTQMEVLFP